MGRILEKEYPYGLFEFGPTLDLIVGNTYEFDLLSVPGHPFYLSSTEDGRWGGGAEYTEGVTITEDGNGKQVKLTIEVTADTPTLYYYCHNHPRMGADTKTALPSVEENADITTVIYDADATDPDGDTLTYSVSGGADQADVTIDSDDGEVRLLNPADYEVKPSYTFNVTASDGELSDTQTVTVYVSDINEVEKKYFKKDYDKNGLLAKRGKINDRALISMLSDKYFYQDPPKSTGFEKFNIQWAEKYKDKFQLSRNSLIATLTQLTSISVSDAINFNNLDSDKIFFAGGGSKNPVIKREILKRTGLDEIKSLPWGLDFKNIESSAFAWLAMTRVKGKPISKGYITGAKSSRLLGIIYR